jgi:CrcB protein
MRSYILVAVGGAVGASMRWGVGESISRTPGTFPFATLLVNVIGCVLIGFAARMLVRGSDRWQIGVTGLLGGLTTYSTFATETRELLDAGHAGQALLYIAVSIIAGLAATELARGDWSGT